MISFMDDFSQYSKTYGEQPRGLAENEEIDPLTGEIRQKSPQEQPVQSTESAQNIVSDTQVSQPVQPLPGEQQNPITPVSDQVVQNAQQNNQLPTAPSLDTTPKNVESAQPVETQGVSAQDVAKVAQSTEIGQQDKSGFDAITNQAQTMARQKIMEQIASRNQPGDQDQKPYDPTGKTPEQIAAETGQQGALDEARKNNVSFAEVLSFKGGANAKVTPQDIQAYKELKQNAEQPLDLVRPQNPSLVDGEKYQPESDIQALREDEKIPGQDEAGAIQADKAESQGGIGFDKAYGQGFTFKPKGQNDLTGQCAWFAQQVTSLPDGNKWTIGSTVAEKKAQLAGHVKNGNAFYRGEDVPQEGNSIVFNGGKWGHVAVVKEILPGGKARLTESNWGKPNTVTHDRVVSLNDPSIMGFVKTKSRY